MRKSLLIFLLLLSFSLLSCKRDKIDWTPVPDSIKNKSTQKGAGWDNTPVSRYTDEITFITYDKKQLTGKYFYNNSFKDSLQPVVILIHQFNSNWDEWQMSFVDSLVSLKYKVFVFNIRGHGSSDKQNGKLESILTDPNQAPLDIKAVVKWLGEQKGADTTRLAAIGTSVGGNMALCGALNLNIKVPIAISNGKETFEAFTGYNEMMMGRPSFPKIKNVLLLCGSKDGDHEAGQKWILENFCSEPKEMKVYDSDAHGKKLRAEHPEMNSQIFNWLKKYL
ncbi:MAG: alpha/beta fold hydrolase [Ignavibacteria bacterium]|nr:alpha/beta fold hydrolase [Ignavibacteria bacterium]